MGYPTAQMMEDLRVQMARAGKTALPAEAIWVKELLDEIEVLREVAEAAREIRCDPPYCLVAEGDEADCTGCKIGQALDKLDAMDKEKENAGNDRRTEAGIGPAEAEGAG